MMQRHECRAESSRISVYIAARLRSEYVQLYILGGCQIENIACDIAGSR